MKRQIVSRHLLRRRARAQEKRLETAQRAVRRGGFMGPEEHAALALLRAYKIDPRDSLHVEKASRGPWRWYVVAS